jgi:hypothetical protein
MTDEMKGGLVSGGLGILGSALGMIGEGKRYRRNMKGQEHLMNIQQQNQMFLPFHVSSVSFTLSYHS